VFNLGVQLEGLHRFFRSCSNVLHERPQYGIERNERMLRQISKGIGKGLFGPNEYFVVEETVRLINLRLQGQMPEARGIIHADLNKGNVIVTGSGSLSFIDYGLFGYGYFLLDAAMGALMASSENRWRFLEGYFGSRSVSEETIYLLEGFMLEAILGYYFFHMENEAVHPWIRERMPRLCEKHCRPFLAGKRIFDRI